jgi:hypothetical protein
MAGRPPGCGGTATVSSGPTLWSTLLMFIGIGEGVGAVIAGIGKFVGWIGSGISSGATIGGWALVAIIAVAVTTAVFISVWAWQSYSALCGMPPVGKFGCVTGVINAVTAGFSQWYSDIVGFANNQPQIDVVVKSDYWPTVTLNNPPLILCAPCTNCPAAVAVPAVIAGGTPGCSPVLTCYYHDSEVCGAAKGAAIGATVGAALGAVGGIIAAAFAMGALGCGFTAVFSWICLIILLVVLLIVILIVVLAALIGSALGTMAGRGGAVGTITPGGGAVPTVTAGSSTLVSGAYVTVVGNLVQSGAALGANALWFAGWIPNANGTTVDDATTTNNSGTMVLGMSTGMAPFCFTDPDTNIPANMDSCPVP